MAIPDQPFGFVAGRWVLSLADTPMDSDRAPDYAPLHPGSVVFNNKLSHRVVQDGAESVGIVKTRIEGKLNDNGDLIDAEGHNYIALPVGVYSVSYSFGQYVWPNHDIEVKAEHTVDTPLWLPNSSPLPSGPAVVQVVTEGSRLAAEAAAVVAEDARDETVAARDIVVVARDETVDAADRAEALAPVLADKVSGPGMSVRVDNSVGTRVLLDHPGGTTMLYGDTGWRDVSGLLINGWTGHVYYRRVNDRSVMYVYDLDPTNATNTRFLPNVPTWQTQFYWRGATFQTNMSWSRMVSPASYVTIPSGLQYGEIRWNSNTTWMTSLPGEPY